MGQSVIQPSFAAGEISPAMWGHVDLAKFHAGLALSRNFIIDHTGGASNRAGTKVVARCKDSSAPTRMIRFVFSSSQAYALEFSHLAMRVHMNGSPVLEPLKVIIGAVQLSPCRLTINGHGFANGDTIFVDDIGGMTQLNGRTFLVANITANTFTLTDLDGNAIDATGFGAYSSGGTAGRVFTLVTPYTSDELLLLKRGTAQSADVMTLCHPNHVPYKLTRLQHYFWTIAPVTFQPTISAPVGQNANAGTAGATTYRYVITAVALQGGQESLPSVSCSCASATMSSTAGSFNTIGWTAVSGGGSYNVYRQLEIPGGSPDAGMQYGFVGNTTSTGFVDHNILPDFSNTPPGGSNPFVTGAIQTVGVTAGGAGYPAEEQLIVTDATGVGAVLQPVITGGVFTAVNVVAGGSNYTAPVFTPTTPIGSGADVEPDSFIAGTANSGVATLIIKDGGSGYAGNITGSHSSWGSFACTFTVVNGSIVGYVITNSGAGTYNGGVAFSPCAINQAQAGIGATFNGTLATAGSNSSIRPNCVTYFQQRQTFGGSIAAPSTIWATRSGDLFNMNFSIPSKDDDALVFSLVSREINEIKHLVPMGSLVAFTSAGAWRIDGGSQSDVITPTRINPVPQAYNGASDVPPIVVGYDILYVQAKGSIVRDLSYNFYANIYTGSDLSLMSSHLFKGRQIVEWAWAEEPHKVVWAIRDDGIALTLTYVKEQDVYAWARHDTLGVFKSVCSIPEQVSQFGGLEDAVYFVINRLVGGKYVAFVERLASRDFQDDVVNAWFVDCGLQYPLSYPAATVTPSDGQGVITLVSDSAVFSNSMVGNRVKLNRGYGDVTQVTDSRHITVSLVKPLASVFPAPAGKWSCTAPVSTVGGLDHLNGLKVGGLIDGNVQTPQVVVNGSIALDHAATDIFIGRLYQGQLQTLPLDVGDPTIQGKRKNIPWVTLRQHNGRGLKVGPDFTQLEEMKERTTDAYILPAVLGIDGAVPVPMTTAAGQPIPLWTGDERINVDNDFGVLGQICVQQDNPLPVTLTALVPEVVMGDG